MALARFKGGISVGFFKEDCEELNRITISKLSILLLQLLSKLKSPMS